MGKKVDAANENIRTLIKELILSESKRMGESDCPPVLRKQYCYDKQYKNICVCNECKGNYFKLKEHELLEKYMVH